MDLNIATARGLQGRYPVSYGIELHEWLRFDNGGWYRKPLRYVLVE